MDETKQTAETGSEEGGDQRQQQIVDMGSSTIRTERGTIHTLTIVGQIEGHQVLPSSAKTTKYEHVMPLLAAIEESDEVDGLLVLLNLHVQAHRLPGAGGRAFHRRASGGVGQEVLYRPVGGHDHPPGAAERPGDRGIPDLQLLCAHPGADYSVCHPEQPCKTGGLHPADAPNRGAGRGCWQRDLRGGGGAPGTD